MSTHSLATIDRIHWVRRLRDWLLFTLTVSSGAVGPPLLVGLRLWASVCLALYVAFWLQLDNGYWAGTAAALACQPPLGASMRKAWFLLVGTMIGAAMIVVLTACFPQDRVGFLGILALWCAICAFIATLLRNFASFGAALAGFTPAIVAADTLGATGGANTDVFMLAVSRASEISIGIVCAGIVLAGSDLGGAQRRLAMSFAALAAEIARQFTGMLAQAGPNLDTQRERRELVRRVIALDPVVDQAIGESSELHYYLPILQAAVHGLFKTFDGWRGVAAHLTRLPDGIAAQRAEALLRSLPPELRAVLEADAPARWMAAPVELRRLSEAAVLTLASLPAGTPSLRLLTDQATKFLAGILRTLDGIALLVGVPGRPPSRHYRFRFSVPDWLPAFVNAARAFFIIAAVELFWVVAAWPNGAFSITYTAIVILLLSPRGDQAYGGALAFTLGAAAGIICAAIIKFAVMPGLETFPAFCVALGLVLIPVGFGLGRTLQSAMSGMFIAMAFNFLSVLAPANQMSYDTAQFYNLALAIFAGSAVGALSFRLLPPLSPALRTRRLLALTLRDLRRVAIDPAPLSSEDWEVRIYRRLELLPEEAKPLQRSQLLAALSVGSDIMQLRCISPSLGLGPELDEALAALSQGHSAMARTWLTQLDHRLASLPEDGPGTDLTLPARASILALSERIADHAAYFDAGAPA